MINRKSHIPLYIQLADEIRNMIVSGEIKIGDKLPSESEMIKTYKLGRLTIRDALSILANEGLVEKHHGKGTFCKACILTPKYRIDVMLDLTDMYFVPHYLHTICSELDSHDVSIVLNDTKNNTDIIFNLIEKAVSEGSDGIIFQPASTISVAPDNLKELLEKLELESVPYIMIDNAYSNVSPSYAMMNEEQSGEIAANYLKSLGHKNMCMVEYRDNVDSALRKKGFARALGYEPKTVNFDSDMFNNISELIKNNKDITAIFCYNDIVAKECYKILEKLSVKIPDDISVVSVDDTVIATTLNPSLTSVVHSKEYLAKAVADAMISIITGKTKWPFTKTFEPSLKIRKSCNHL